MIQDQRAKAVGIVKSGFINTWFVDINKGDNCVVISLWLVTSPVVPYVMAPMNLAFNKLLEINELVR